MPGPLGDPPFNMRVPKTAELLAGNIRREIVRGVLKEGDALPSEAALMEEFSISRPTLREAFRILESEGLINVRRGARGGARVQVPSSEVAARYAGLVLQSRGATVADVLDARVIVEAPAARMLAQRRDRAKGAARLQQWIDEHPDVFEPRIFKEFNNLVVALTESETLILIATLLEYIYDAATARYTRVPHESDERLARKAHRARLKLVSLVDKGDDAGAEELWRSYLVEANRTLISDVGTTVVDLFT